MDSLALGNQTYSEDELIALLGRPVVGDASLVFAKQLIAARLNLASGAYMPAWVRMFVAQSDSVLDHFPGKLPYMVRPFSLDGRRMLLMGLFLNRVNRCDGDFY